MIKVSELNKEIFIGLTKMEDWKNFKNWQCAYTIRQMRKGWGDNTD